MQFGQAGARAGPHTSECLIHLCCLEISASLHALRRLVLLGLCAPAEIMSNNHAGKQTIRKGSQYHYPGFKLEEHPLGGLSWSGERCSQQLRRKEDRLLATSALRTEQENCNKDPQVLGPSHLACRLKPCR